MIGHVAQWLIQGTTLSPVEPSEAMEFFKHGVVNTGLVFFTAAILATAVFGRFFCGWGCHLIALQDLSRWLLIKIGIRPRPLRSRLLGLVPVIAFTYMFLWPLAYRVAVGDRLGPVSSAFVVADFWATFPGLTVAVLTFLVCGFAIVYVLGSKGYCAYGCPYGAVFGFADRVAPIRVRVTDACQGCATCTAVCTSNVRVHEEVRDHAMVVDPGCMKCLDCVANCPNGALYAGAGRPALGRSRGRKAPGSLSWPEEAVTGAAFIAAFAAFRGLYGMVPFLFSLGLAAIVAGLALAGWRLIGRRDVRLGPSKIKADGRLQRIGWAFVALMIVVFGFWCHSVVVQVLTHRGRALFDRTADLRRAALDLQRSPSPSGVEDRELAADARRTLMRLEAWSLIDDAATDLDLAWLELLGGNRAAAKTRVDEVLAERPLAVGAHLIAARILVDEARPEEASMAFSRVVELDPQNPAGYLGLGTVLATSGRLEAAFEVFSRGLDAVPGSADLRYNIGLTLALTGDLDGAAREFRTALERAPDHAPARENLAGVLAAAGRFDDAIPVYEEAIRRSPDDPQLRIMAARAMLGGGRPEQAAEQIEAAISLDPGLTAARSLLEPP
jgi:tetratricopeptide (TPR) repeat protein/NAD-dependent dihydropyrimidine dehydrogenase PreA subunit